MCCASMFITASGTMEFWISVPNAVSVEITKKSPRFISSIEKSSVGPAATIAAVFFQK